MRVSSPTRAVGYVLASMAVVLTLAAPASAAPKAPGNFTGFGFDTCSAPSQKTMNLWRRYSPFSAVGIYISGNSRYCGDKYQPNLTPKWVATNAARGWRFIPIHVGYQSPCFKNNPGSRVQKKHMSTNISTARSQARSDARETIKALRRLGFPKRSVSYLDLEWYSRTDTCDNATLEFIDAWTETLHAAGYKSGVYSSGSAAIKAMDDAIADRRKGFTRPDHAWIAWTNGKADVDAGPYLSRSGAFAKHQRIHQYSNGKSVTYGGANVTIDWDFLDVGRGTVAKQPPRPCGVRMDFPSYPKLRVGDRNARVAALQCLLTKRGYNLSVNGSFNSSTAKALNRWRAKLGWPTTSTKNAATTQASWTALHAAGYAPYVLKRGSHSPHVVRRLQRALLSAGADVRLTGVFDARTAEAVKDYRDENGAAELEVADATVWKLLQRGAQAD